MDVAIVGFGKVAELHAAGYERHTPGLRVAAVVDPTPARRVHAARLMPGARVYADLEELLEDDRRVDVVDICSPPSAHRDQIELALRAGCDVICEKPVFLSGADAIDVLTCVGETGRLLFPCHNYLHSPHMDALRWHVDAGEIGQLVAGECVVERPGHSAGVREWRQDWRRDLAIAGGGILLDHGTHCIYMGLALTGTVPQRVACRVDTPNGATETTAELTLDFGGVAWRVVLSWRGTRRLTRYALHGTAGDVCVEHSGGNGLGVAVPGVSKAVQDQRWFGRMLEEFLSTARQRRGMRERLREAAITCVVLEAAYASARAGCEPVDLELDEVLAALPGDETAVPARNGH